MQIWCHRNLFFTWLQICPDPNYLANSDPTLHLYCTTLNLKTDYSTFFANDCQPRKFQIKNCPGQRWIKLMFSDRVDRFLNIKRWHLTRPRTISETNDCGPTNSWGRKIINSKWLTSTSQYLNDFSSEKNLNPQLWYSLHNMHSVKKV